MKNSEQPKSPQRQSTTQAMKKSSFVTELELQRKERIANIQPNKRQLSFSTFLDMPPQILRTAPKDQQRHPDAQSDIKRARSLKQQLGDKVIAEEERSPGLSQNVLRLRTEEMAFKFKTKMAGLLKQLAIPSSELSRFGKLERIEDMLHFFTDKVRERLVNNELKEASLHRARSKEKQALGEYEAELESLRRKLHEKEDTEKILKVKLKQSHAEVRELLDRVSQKEKELSLKATEIYQLKTTLKESERTFSHLQARHDILEKEAGAFREQHQFDTKDVISVNHELEEENLRLKEKVQELKQELEGAALKQTTLSELNSHLNQELTRWRERFEDGELAQLDTKKSSETKQDLVEVVLLSNRDLKKSTMSMSNFYGENAQTSSHPRFSLTAIEIENMKLSNRIEELENRNKQLSRDILNYATIKERYEQTLGVTGEPTGPATDKRISFLKEPSELPAEVDQLYKRRVEAIAKEWKDKLYDVVHRYEDDLQNAKQTTDGLLLEKDRLQKIVKDLAREKYQLQNKLIQAEKQIYELQRPRSKLSKEGDSVRGSKASHFSEELGEQGVVLQQQSRGGSEAGQSRASLDGQEI